MKWLIGSECVRIYISLALFVACIVIWTNNKRTQKQKWFLLILSGVIAFILLTLAKKLLK